MSPSSLGSSGRRGISLLEVLIAIGLLAIGLISVLSLLPAGRTYVVQAERDDRCTALVPDAIATMEALGLFAEDSLEWRSVVWPTPPAPPADDGEQPAERPEWHDPRPWTRAPADTTRRVTISEFYPADPSQQVRISGQIDPASKAESVELTITKNGEPYAQVVITDPAIVQTGNWEYNPTFGPPGPETDRGQTRIVSEGPSAGEPLAPSPQDDYQFTARFLDSRLNPPAMVATPANPPTFTINGRRRRTDEVTGQARIVVTIAPDQRFNEDRDSARVLSVPGLDDDSFRVGAISKIRMVRQADVRVQGEIWRFDEGDARLASYREFREFANPSQQSNANATTTSLTWPEWDNATSNPGDLVPGNEPGGYWKDRPDDYVRPEDVDFFRMPVRKGYGVKIDWNNSASIVSKLSDNVLGRSPTRLFPFDFKGQGNWLPISPYEDRSGDLRYATYSVPNDGELCTAVGLNPGAINPGAINTVSYPGPRNEEYGFDLRFFRSDRMVAIDPLMAVHLDRVIGLSGGTVANHPLGNRRRYFAEFEQTYTAEPSNPRAFVIPRLNWKIIADNPDFDAAVAAADRLCRAEDGLATRELSGEDDPPGPLFDTDAAGNVLRRQFNGRMTWMLTIQPEDLGSVQANWKAGKAFETSIVVFEDRPFPTGGAFRGEYAFESGWSDADGMLHVHVPLPATGGPPLTDEELKRLFAAGSWLLLGPRVVLTSAPVDNDMALEWIRIRSSEFERRGTEVVARVLLDKEPATNVLLRPANPAAIDPLRLDPEGRLRLMTLAYEGVAAVVKRSMIVRAPQ